MKTALLRRPVKKNDAGFTLIELLVTVVVLGLIMTAVVGVFLTTIKAGKKADAIAEVKENGDYALGLMERVLRNAEEIKKCDPELIEFRLPDDNPSDPNWGFLYGQSEPGGNYQIFSNNGALTNRDLMATGLSFACDGDPEKKEPVKTITISFTLSKGKRSDVREFASVYFEGMVKVRKY